MLSNIFKKDWSFVLILSSFLIIITSLPFVYGYLSAPAGQYYLGFHNLAPGDYSVYFSYILQFYQGHFLFSDLYTAEPQSGNIINTFWDLTGLAGKIFHLSPFWAFHLARILAIPALISVLYLFAHRYFPVTSQRRLAIIFFLFATGISALLAPFFYKNFYEVNGYINLPMDLWVAESNIFLSMLHSGHMIASLVLLMLIFHWSLKFLEKNNYKYSLMAGLGALALLSFHPFPLPIIFCVLTVFWLAISSRDRRINWFFFKHILIIFFISLPLLVYYFIELNFDLVTIIRAKQNICLTPAWYFLFTGFGFLLIFGAIGCWRYVREHNFKDNNQLFIAVWLPVQLALIFLPFNFQRRLVGGLQIPLTIFALAGLAACHREFKNNKIFSKYIFNNKLLLIFLFISLFTLSNFFVLALDIHSITARAENYYPVKEIDAMNWIKNNLGEQNLILANPKISGHFIPGIAGRRVFAGHWVETIFYNQKTVAVDWFFNAETSDDEKLNFLSKNKITHIFYGQSEKKLGGYELDNKPYYREVFGNEAVKIYQAIY